MPRKLKFQVVHVSGYEGGHGPKELEIHSPITKGWQSQKFCVYPQEVVLKLEEPARLRKLQILVHQYLVASKVEIYTGLASNPQSPSLLSCKFKRLGYISLSSNESSDFKTRELKSVNLDVDCHFVKLLVHKNHVNKHNLFNQVNVIAINLIGDPIDEMTTETQRINTGQPAAEEIIQHFMNGGNAAELKKDFVRGSRPDYVSPLDDLAFDIYQDSETAQLIRRLEAKKQDAVLEERFDYAKKLKQAMADLHKVGEKLGRFEVEKRRAIEMEDYDLAKTKKLQADEYRLHVYKQLDLPDLLEIKQEKQKKQSPATVHSPPVQPEARSPKAPHTPVLPQIVTKTNVVRSSPGHNESPVPVKLPRTPEPDTPRTPRRLSKPPDIEDRPIPVLKGKAHLDEQAELPPEGNDNKSQDEEKPQELSEKDESEASLIIEVYGLYLVQLAYSKVWKHRQEATETVLAEITAETPKLIFESEAKAVVKATTMLLKRMLTENVFTVFAEAVKIEKMLLTEFIPKKKLGKSEYNFVIDKTLPALLTRSGDLAARTKETAMNSIQEIALLKDVKALGIVPEILMQPIKSKGQAPWRLFKSRLKIILKLLEPLDVDKQGSFTTNGVMKMVMKALEHSHKEVREVAIEIIFEMYKKVGNAVRSDLPPDEPFTRKNPLYSRIFDGLDKIDGKPTKAERKLQAKQDKDQMDQAKKNEITALQDQLKALRAAAEDYNKEGEQPSENEADPKDPDAVNLETMCMFCGEQNENFSTETLEVHYWKSCPMLKRCSHCSQIVEVCNLNDHLLTECDKKTDFKKCPRCQEALLKVDIDAHVKAKTCPPTRGDKPFNRCPLCKEKLSQGDEVWKKHLTTECKANVKRLQQQKNLKAGSKPAADKKGINQPQRGVVKRRTSKAPGKAPTTSDKK